MLKTRWMVLVAAALLLGGNGVAMAGMIHASTEVYYPNGSTFVDFEEGYGTDFWVGDPSEAPSLWQVNDKAYYEEPDDYTWLVYTVHNDTYGYNPLPWPQGNITSFHVYTVGVVPYFWTTNFTDTYGNTWFGAYNAATSEIGWSTADAGLAYGQAANMFEVYYYGQHTIGFDYILLDLDHGDPFGMDNWVVSTIPAPGAALLGVIGLAAIAWIRRRL